ncbi:MAG: DinB family protein [Bacteroidota bacterium]
MKPHIDNLRATRRKFMHFIEEFSLIELNKIPEGFSNNMLWNIAHVVVTQQLLIYKNCGLNGYLEQTFIDKFRKGTKPEGAYTTQDLQTTRENLLLLVTNFENDIENQIFKSYTNYETSFGITLNTIDDAIVFNNMHETLHLGYIMAMRRAMSH